jgi:hypothetical protein
VSTPLDRIAELAPPPASPAPVDWTVVEERLGTPLPRDYKQLVDTYGGGVFDETVWVLEPGCRQDDYDLLTMAEERREVLAQLWKSGEARPGPLEAAGTGLLPWAYVEGGGQFLYWLVDGGDPDAWTVMANEGRGPEWEHHDATCTEFLLSALTGRVRSEVLAQLPAEEHTFDANEEIFAADDA